MPDTSSMACSLPRIPTDILENVAALVIAEYLDDVLLGPLALPKMELVDESHIEDPAASRHNPVEALLVASFELRHATLYVLSKAFVVRLDPTGLGRLDTKPWTKIMALRRVLSAVTGVRDMAIGRSYINDGNDDDPPVLFLYLMIKGMDTALPPTLLCSELVATGHQHPAAASLVRNLLEGVQLYDMWRTVYLPAYHACLPAFQATAGARVSKTLMSVTVATVYSTHQYTLEGMLVVIDSVGLTLREDNSYGLQAFQKHMHDIKNEDQDAVRCWGPDLDRAIGKHRFRAWNTTLQSIAQMRLDDSRFDNVRDTAQNLLASFQARLSALLSLGTAPAAIDLPL
ncbi:hypothetical protein PsYK624_011800 [Phanerochaete sordida]|uniref:Uncharacterized protein n=1 Tax=Phanerochaete sordida TaxID=48140 RepID=A0A9P3FYV1_9APHY|nr:hypothetical protein PsYK624_011800 [Phanerochaete sordida]